MSLVDQYGRPVSVDRKFIRASQRGPQNPYQKIRLGDINDLINAYDYRTILSLAAVCLLIWVYQKA